ncbi:MAG TPA: carbohydrate kinase family protein [Anaerolineae bacterium]|nr:carbohydrate kinase family protein [Anaerolineae bacterium]
MKSYDLLVIGEINPDLIVRGSDIAPEFNQIEKLVEEATLTIGASSVIMACGAAKLGLRVAFIGLVGNDFFGQFMLQEMQSCNIDTSACVVDVNLSTGISIILSNQYDRAILTYPGSIPKLNKSHINLDIFQYARHLHMGGYFLLKELRPQVPELFRFAREQGLTTSLDTNWDPQEKWGIAEVLPYCDVFLPNENELLNISGEKNVDAGLEKMSKQVSTLAVKLGEKGAIARREGELAVSPALKVNVIDTVGAGDSFDAGFIFGWLNSYSLQKTLEIACICGSLSTQSSGGTSGQASLNDLERHGVITE